MRVVLLALSLFTLLPADAEAGRFFSYRWPTDAVIVVENWLGSAANKAVAATVAAWRRVLPRQ